tara:strand:+ start:595 stop:1959 length:1365 start_codon:yes stop_codon:yes gene_type:complete
MSLKKDEINNIFYIFLTIHLLIWTLVPALSNSNLPLDTIEALAWGSNLEWGFNKHPPASAFFAEVFYQIFGNSDWSYYLLSQLFVVLAFFVVWKFCGEFFQNNFLSLISVLLLEGIYFYNYTTPEFNVYVCELPFWGLTVFYCWKSIKENYIKNWIFFGFFAAIGVLSHYLFIYLLLGIEIFFVYLIIKEKKFHFKYLIPGIIFILILSPHLIWLIENNYSTIIYGLHRTGLEEPNFLSHFTHPLIFLGKQIGILIPFFIMFLFIISKFKLNFDFKDKKLLFLIAMNIVPIISIFLTSLIMGVKIRTMWMTPFYLFMGVFFVYIFQAQINLNKFKNFISVFLILFIFSPFAYYYVSITQTDKRTDYPGKEIAALVQKEWNKVNDVKPIVYVGSDEWHAGNLSYHLKDRPIVVMDNSLIYKNNFIEIDEFSENYICKYSQNKIIVDTKEYLICFK